MQRRLIHPPKRPTDQRDAPASRSGRSRYRRKPSNIRGKTSDCDALIMLPEEVGKRLCQAGFRAGPSLIQNICQIADHGEDAFLSKRPESFDITCSTDHRVRVEFPVSCMQHGSAATPDRQPVCLRDRVRECNEFELERSKNEIGRDIDLNQFTLLQDTFLGQLPRTSVAVNGVA